MNEQNNTELSEVHRTLATENPAFRSWVESMDGKLWARFDLSAARLGWEAAIRSTPPHTGKE